ncbi:hypothetical protein M9H77_21437 [Catharanthus roseus]|uniref:Uncharacterized protein n=1 Tax=Catharanthus roseus TaxID=4058 RepID=A0ACC0APN0_CATRO|nr:hypothetical protein M9H77_21437 [Catharanthus roseus]
MDILVVVGIPRHNFLHILCDIMFMRAPRSANALSMENCISCKRKKKILRRLMFMVAFLMHCSLDFRIEFNQFTPLAMGHKLFGKNLQWKNHEIDVIASTGKPDWRSDHVYSFLRIELVKYSGWKWMHTILGLFTVLVKVGSIYRNHWPTIFKSVYTRRKTPEKKFENIVRGTACSVMQKLVDSPREGEEEEENKRKRTKGGGEEGGGAATAEMVELLRQKLKEERIAVAEAEQSGRKKFGEERKKEKWGLRVGQMTL